MFHHPRRPLHFADFAKCIQVYSKRFNLCIDGLQDAFIKDKVIDIMTYFSNQYDLTYTLNNNYASVCCKPEIFSKLIQFIACRNIDILSATYKTRALHNARIS